MPLRIAFPGVSACLRISAIAFVVLTRAFAATYYVSPSGNDNHSGLSEAAAVATPQVAVDLANPGDTVLIMDGTYVHTHPWEIIRLRAKHRGSPTQWLTIKAYPGHKPVLKKYRSGAFWNAIDLSDGAAYVELNGLTVEGWNDELTLAEAQADYAQPNPSFVFNANGINVDGRNRPVAERPRHVRIINCTVRGFPAMGIGFAWADYVTAEGN
nr:hypothetical protein [Opitutaceae bacterium]